MASAASSSKLLLADDVPWRASPAGAKPVPKIHQNPVLRLPQNPSSSYALAILKKADPIGEGFAMEATLEAAGPECLVPGQVAPVKLLGLKVWPIEVDLKFLEPVGRELKAIGKILHLRPVPKTLVNRVNSALKTRLSPTLLSSRSSFHLHGDLAYFWSFDSLCSRRALYHIL